MSLQLYVYDLSQGMARTLSLALTGKQIDAIYHTSVTVFGLETYYGQGLFYVFYATRNMPRFSRKNTPWNTYSDHRDG
jgi:hypothetical protein